MAPGGACPAAAPVALCFHCAASSAAPRQTVCKLDRASELEGARELEGALSSRLQPSFPCGLCAPTKRLRARFPINQVQVAAHTASTLDRSADEGRFCCGLMASRARSGEPQSEWRSDHDDSRSPGYHPVPRVLPS